MRSVLLTLAVAVLLPQASISEADAQATRSRTAARVAAKVVLSDRLPPDSRFIVRRSPRSAHHDVIVLAQDANEAELGNAIRMLLTIRQRHGDIPSEERTLRIRPGGTNLSSRLPFPWIGRVLGDVKRAERVDVGGVGVVRAVQIWLPRQNRTHTLHREPRT